MREIEKAPCSVLNPFDHYQFQFCWQLGQLCSIVHSGMTSYCTFLTFFYHFHFSLVDFDPVPDSNSDFRLALQKIASICLHLSSSTNFSVFTRHQIYLRNSWKRHLLCLSVQSNSNSKHSQNVSSKCKRHFLSLFKFADTCILNSFSVRTFESLLTIRIGHWRVKNWPKAMPKSLASVYNTNITFKNNIVVLTGCE